MGRYLELKRTPHTHRALMRNTYLQFGTKNVAADLNSGGRTLLAFCNFKKKLSQRQFLQLVLRMFPTSSYVI